MIRRTHKKKALAVVFLENEILYGHAFPVTEEMQKEDFVLPIGKCKIERSVYFCTNSFCATNGGDLEVVV